MTFFGRSMEPDQRGIFRTLFKTPAITGLAGTVMGLLLFAWFYNSGEPMVASCPLLAFTAIVGFATTFRLLPGGLLTMRPRHIKPITSVRSDQWALVLHYSTLSTKRKYKRPEPADGQRCQDTRHSLTQHIPYCVRLDMRFDFGLKVQLYPNVSLDQRFLANASQPAVTQASGAVARHAVIYRCEAALPRPVDKECALASARALTGFLPCRRAERGPRPGPRSGRRPGRR